MKMNVQLTEDERRALYAETMDRLDKSAKRFWALQAEKRESVKAIMSLPDLTEEARVKVYEMLVGWYDQSDHPDDRAIIREFFPRKPRGSSLKVRR